MKIFSITIIMWTSVLILLLTTISINNCLTFESSRLGVTGNLQNTRGGINNNNQKYNLNIDYDGTVNQPKPSEYEGGKLIGKWRSTGDAIEPKWRDGDSVPLVPFEEAATLRRVVPKNKEKPLSPALLLPSSPSGPLPTPLLAMSPHSDVLTNRLHEIQHAKIRYLNAPITEIKPIPEFISEFKDIKTFSPDYNIRPIIRPSDFPHSFQNGTRRYRIRKPQKSQANLYLDEHGVGYLPEPILVKSKLGLVSDDRQKSSTTGERVEIKKTTTVTPIIALSRPYNNNKHNNHNHSSKSDNNNSYDNNKKIYNNYNDNNSFKNNSAYEFNDEEYQRPRPRKRKPPTKSEFSELKNTEIELKRTRRPDRQNPRRNRIKNNELTDELSMNQRIENTELKALLKMQQIEGLSLSEILQQRNLSLSDLLKGKSDIINALKVHNNTNDNVESVSNNRQNDYISRIPIALHEQSPLERPRSRTTVTKNSRRKLINDDNRYNQFQTITITTSPSPSLSPSVTVPIVPSTTIRPHNNNYWSETKGDLNGQQQQQQHHVIELTRDNKRKLKDSEVKATTKAIAKLTESFFTGTMNYSPKKTTLMPATLNIREINIDRPDSTVHYEPKRQPTTSVPRKNAEEDEIMEFSDFSKKISTTVTNLRESLAITTLRPTLRHEEIGITTRYNEQDDRDDGGSTLSIEQLLSTESPKLSSATIMSVDEDQVNTLIEYNKSDENDANCNDASMMIEYQNDGVDDNDTIYDDEDEYYDMPETTTNFEDPTTIDNEQEIEQTTDESAEDSESKGDDEQEVPPNHRPTPSIVLFNNNNYDQVIAEIEPEARAEILELISSGSSAHRLSEILRSRNMSFDELVALRQRGSSKVHLAGIARPKSRSHKFTSEKTTQTINNNNNSTNNNNNNKTISNINNIINHRNKVYIPSLSSLIVRNKTDGQRRSTMPPINFTRATTKEFKINVQDVTVRMPLSLSSLRSRLFTTPLPVHIGVRKNIASIKNINKNIGNTTVKERAENIDLKKNIESFNFDRSITDNINLTANNNETTEVRNININEEIKKIVEESTKDTNKDEKNVENLEDIELDKNIKTIEIMKNIDNTTRNITDQSIDYLTDKTPIIINISCTDEEKVEKIDTAIEKNSLELVDLLNAFDSLPFSVHKNFERIATTEFSHVTKNEELQAMNKQINPLIIQAPEQKIYSNNKTNNNDNNNKTNNTDNNNKTNNNGDNNKNNDKTNGDAVDSLEVGSVEEIIKKFEDENIVTNTNSTNTIDDNNTEFSVNETERKTLSKIRPSIIASCVILAMTIVGFLALFITCRIRQKQRYMYKNSFSKAVFQAPAVNGRKLSNSSSLNTIMVNVVATSTTKRTAHQQHETQEVGETFDCRSDIDHDSLDANDSWETIPDFMK